MEQAIISIHDLTKTYGKFVAVDGLNLNIRHGEIFGLLGPNGAGKSTTILMLLGLTEASSGSIIVDGINPQRDPVEAKKIIGYLPDNIGFYEGRSGLDNLMLIAELNGWSRGDAATKAEELLGKVGLAPVMKQKVSTYSRGMKQRLGLAEMLIKEPKIVIMDEPTLGLDPVGVKDFLALIKSLRDNEGLTVLLSSHHLHQVQEVCDRVGLFVKGKLVAEGNVETLAETLFHGEQGHLVLELATTAEDICAAIEAKLLNMSGVTSVARTGSLFQIAHQLGDMSPVLELLVRERLPVQQVCQKRYGLDDIYAYYFEEKV